MLSKANIKIQLFTTVYAHKTQVIFFIKKGCTVYTVGALSKKFENKMIYICMYIVSG